MLMVEVLVDRMASLRQARSRSAKICCLIFRFCGGPMQLHLSTVVQTRISWFVSRVHICTHPLIEVQLLQGSQLEHH